MVESFLGIDLGGTNIKTGVVDATGAVLSKNCAPTQPEHGPEKIMERMHQLGREAIEQAGLTLSLIHI